MRSASSAGSRARMRHGQTGLIRQQSLKARAQAVRDHLRPYSYQGRMRQLQKAQEVDKVTAQNERLVGTTTNSSSSRNNRAPSPPSNSARDTKANNNSERKNSERKTKASTTTATPTPPKRATSSRKTPTKHSLIKRIKSDSALPKGIGSQYIRPDYHRQSSIKQRQQHVIVTLPQPKLVAPTPPTTPPPNSSSSSSSFRRLGSRTYSNRGSRRLTSSQTFTVPALLSFDAQENLERLQLQTQREEEEKEEGSNSSTRGGRGGKRRRTAKIRRAPRSPGSFDDDDDDDGNHSSRSRRLNRSSNSRRLKRDNNGPGATRGLQRDPSLRDFQLLSVLPDEETELFRQELSELGELTEVEDEEGGGGGGGTSSKQRQKREFKRISTFHMDVSESLALSDDDADDPFGTNKGMIPSIQLDPRNIIICVISFVVVMTIVLGATLSPVSGDDDDIDPFNNNYGGGGDNGISTIDIIQERGYVKCGIRRRRRKTTMMMTSFPNIGNNESSANNMMTMSDDLHRFNLEQCRAMALIALGNATKYETVWVEMDNRFELLANKTVDIITEETAYTMGRDVFESNTKTGFTFTTPYFYAGLMIAGNPEYVDCLEALSGVNVDCQGLRICTLDGSMHHEILLDVFNGVTIVPNDSVEGMESKIQSGVCNVVAAEPLFLSQTQDMFSCGGGDPDDGHIDRQWKMGGKVLSFVPLSHATRQDDSEWSTMADLAINAFIISETQDAAQQLAIEWAVDQNFLENGDDGDDDVDGDGFDDYRHSMIVDFKSLLLKLIMEYGEYGGYYETHMEALIPPGFGLNEVYDQDATTGLLSSYPFGNLNELGPGPLHNGTLDAILTRGYLICGVMPSRGPWFASTSSTRTETEIKSIKRGGSKEEWVGFDVELCRGVTASLFGGDDNKVVFVELGNDEQPYTALSSKEVDVVAGARMNLQAMYREPKSGQSFSFSTPYYYDNDTHDAFAFMTRQNDPQWSEYCFWIVMGTIYAEEKSIVATNSTEMPAVTLFGESLKEMLSDCIGSIGNYGELYNRTLQEFIPRSGANLLNDGTGPQLYPVPVS